MVDAIRVRFFALHTVYFSLIKSRKLQLEIPLPSFEEQKRIAAILDQADSLRRLRQRASDRLSSLALGCSICQVYRNSLSCSFCV